MIYVESIDSKHFGVKFKRPVGEHTGRMRQVASARFVDKDTGYRVPLSSFDEFEDLFWDEIIFITPRHILLGEPLPKAPKFYQNVLTTPIQGITQPLYPFQTFGAHFLAWVTENYQLGFLTDGMGLGKTVQSIAGALLMAQKGLVNRVLVVCLASLRKQWVREGVEAFTQETALAVYGDANQRKALYTSSLANKVKFTVISYESLLHDMPALMKGKYDLVIFDEAHKLKNKIGKINRAAERLMRPIKSKKYAGIPYAFFLTGTPLMNKLEELYGLFKLKDRGIFGTYDDFCDDFMYCKGDGEVDRYGNPKPRKVGASRDIIGYKHLSELRRVIKFYMLRRTANEVDIELPKVIEKWHYSEMNALQKKLEDMITEEKVRVDGAFMSTTSPQQKEKLDNARKNVQNIRQAIADHPQLFLLSGSERIREEYGAVVAKSQAKSCPKFMDLMDIVDEIVDGGDKVVIFTQFKRMLDLIDKELLKRGIITEIYHGGMNDDQKDDAKHAFRTDPDVRVLIATEAGSTGLNLQVARYQINYDLPWNPAIYQQRYGRIARLGSNFKQVTVINMITEGSCDEDRMATIREKEHLFNATVENDAGQTRELHKLMNQEAPV